MENELKNRIVAYIQKHSGVTDTELMSLAKSKNFTESVIYDALQSVQRDKRIKTKVNDDNVVYTYQEPKVASPQPHLDWVRSNYPWPENFIMPFPEMDLSWMFLRTLEERDDYRAAMSGRPKYLKPKYGQAR